MRSPEITNIVTNENSVEEVSVQGTLKIHIKVIDGKKLIIEGHGYLFNCSQSDTSFIKVFLVYPGKQVVEKASSEIQVEFNGKVTFNQTFVLTLPEVLRPHTLKMNLFHKKNNSKKSAQVLGCIGFGMKNLICKNKTKEIEGNYYLVNDRVASNLPATSSVAGNDAGNLSSHNKRHRNSPINAKYTHKICISRSQDGFGFTLKGNALTRIGRVRRLGSAHKAGLRSGDYVISLNGIPAQSLSATTLARIVKKCEDHVELVVYRTPDDVKVLSPATHASSETPTTHATSAGTPARTRQSNSNARINTSSATPRICSRVDNLRPRILNSSNVAGVKRKMVRQHHMLDTPTLVCRIPLETPRKHARLDESSLIFLDELDDSRYSSATCDARHTTRDTRHTDDSFRSRESSYSRCSRASTTRKNVSKCNSEGSLSNNSDTSSGYTSCHSNGEDSCKSRHTQPVVSPAPFCAWSSDVSSIGEDFEGQLRNVDELNTSFTEMNSSTIDRLRLNMQKLHSVGQNEMFTLISRVLDIEDDFIVSMRAGVQRYSAPLKVKRSARHINNNNNNKTATSASSKYLDNASHQEIFQNIEQLIAISEFHLTSLSDSCDLEDKDLKNWHVAKVYSERIAVTCKAYTSYERGLKTAMTRVAEVKSGSKFISEFLSAPHSSAEVTSDISTVERFLCRPIQHLRMLKSIMEKICGLRVDEYTQSFERIISGLTIRPRRESFAENEKISEPISIVNKIADCLKFDDHVEPFLLNDGRRRLIFVGEMMWRESRRERADEGVASKSGGRGDNCRGWSRVTAMVFDDVLLLTRAVADVDLSTDIIVTHAPILHKNIVSSDFLDNGDGFCLECDSTSGLDLNDYRTGNSGDCGETDVHEFMTPSASDNNLWRSLVLALTSDRIADPSGQAARGPLDECSEDNERYGSY